MATLKLKVYDKQTQKYIDKDGFNEDREYIVVSLDGKVMCQAANGHLYECDQDRYVVELA